MTTSVSSDYTLSERQWKLAHAVAQQLVFREADANELGKAMAYLRAIADRSDAGEHFFKYLETLATQGHRIGHSKRTRGYFVSMNEVCQEYLKGEVGNPAALMQIVGWAFRLMRYYTEGVPPDVLKEMVAETEALEVQSERQAEIAEVVAQQEFEVGQQLDAAIAAIKGNKVTYEILGTIRLTQKEPRKATSLSEGQSVRVEIAVLKDDGSIKKVQLLN